MRIRQIIYSLAVVALICDVVLTMLANRGPGFADNSPVFGALSSSGSALALTVFTMAALIFYFVTCLKCAVGYNTKRARIGLLLADFFAVYLLCFEAVAIPHNIMVVLRAGAITNAQTYYILEGGSVAFAALVVGISRKATRSS